MAAKAAAQRRDSGPEVEKPQGRRGIARRPGGPVDQRRQVRVVVVALPALS